MKGNEKSDTQKFWLGLLRDILGISQPEEYIEFEKRVELTHISFIDAYIPSTGIVIEQKSREINLDLPAKQSDGTIMTPFEQAKRYRDWLPASQQGRYIIVCNFNEFRIHDMEQPKAPPRIIKLEHARKENLSFLVNPNKEQSIEEIISLEAGRLVGRLYNALLQRYSKKATAEVFQSLNIFCVRIVFLLYAEDSGIFNKSQFHDYLKAHMNTARVSLLELFSVLNTPEEQRDEYLEDDLAAFPYINGRLFGGTEIELPKLDGEIMNIIIAEMSEGFDWSGINPTIFGALFESTLNPDTRRIGGMHYTSIKNIHRVIDGLFLNDLTEELTNILKGSQRVKKLLEFQRKLSSLNFLDPACGSGNFLTETYLSLRRLENKVINELSHGQKYFAQGEFSPIQVKISQFYGIEINDFAVSVARTALWIAEHQMMKATHKLIAFHDDFIPLKSYSNVIEGNAIRIDWTELISPSKLNYIMGNPPFRGARVMESYQKEDVNKLFSGWGKLGDLDYVCCWYKKTFDFMKGTQIRAAFVSTNSINQGDTVSMFWKRLTDEGLSINFAYRTFIWNNEAQEQVHVNCMIIGFSAEKDVSSKRIFIVSGKDPDRVISAEHINAYLLDAPDWYVFNRMYPLCDVPCMRIGNKPIDGGFYLLTQEQYYEFIKREPKAEQYFHLWYGGQEFLYNMPRMCLYLGNCTPHEIKMMPECMKRVEAVRQYRLASKSKPTQKLADTPTHFHVETFPEGSYIVVPQVSSEKRKYIPMGFLDDSVMCGSQLKIIPDATLYHFGILESLIHMAWVRVVAGRLRSDYRYSNTLVYNCFVWPEADEKQRSLIERTAQYILDARGKYPDSNLAELYNETLMPKELRKAHRENDEAVCEAYGFPKDIDEYDIVARLFRLYHNMT